MASPQITPAVTRSSENGLAGRLMWFVMVTAVAVVMSLVSAWGVSVQRTSEHQSERITKVEERQAQLERSLARIETKLDLLLEQRVRR